MGDAKACERARFMELLYLCVGSALSFLSAAPGRPQSRRRERKALESFFAMALILLYFSGSSGELEIDGTVRQVSGEQP